MAQFVDQDEPVIMLVGQILTEESVEDGSSFKLLVAENTVVEVPGLLRDFLTYLETPRYESDVLSWVADAGGSASDVKKLVDAGRLRRVPQGPSESALNAFAGLRLVPMCYRVRVSESGGSVVYVGHTPDATAVQPISWLLAEALRDPRDGEDFPSAVRRLAADSGLRMDQTVRLALSDLDGLLAHKLARLGLVKPAQREGLASRLRALFTGSAVAP
ncbi:hypothetical protein [Pseudarthrobacter sp. AB1]|uniref:hypothetical protein n=1 Tax=Pseudarthrobacter sp. AB1 TaxID=2138309 RepID=UPI00186B794F|nr:hypothetical protein [Pseudarthrobacter sp. AB1]MBE4719519.1 hypothetical protein [Pseudarthrobacter sp. AB1]